MHGIKQSPLMPHISHRRITLAAYTLIVIGIAGLLLAGWVYARQSRPLGAESVEVTSAPSSVKPSAPAVANYVVPSTLPRYIAIPALDIDNTRIIQLGVLKHRQIATPDNIHDTGWYKDSAEPGKPGAMFIYGHVSNWKAEGVFHDLAKLKQGDKITVTSGEGKAYTYQVAETKIYDYRNVDMNAVLSPVNPNKPGLNLMTCTGKIIKGTNQFNERLVVFASLVKN